jgi:hypothetical protein
MKYYISNTKQSDFNCYKVLSEVQPTKKDNSCVTGRYIVPKGEGTI